MEFWGDAALPLLDAFAARLGLAAPDVPWITARDRVAEFAGLLALVTGTLAKIGNEIFELQRPEIGEVAEPFTPGQVGSITMPHKRNPELAEHLDTLARVVRADAAVTMEGLVALHERDGRSWKAEWLVLPEACQLTGAALGFAGKLLEGLQVDGDRMRANLDARRGYLLSEPLMRALADRIGKHAAHEAIYEAAMAGLAAGVDLTDKLRADGLLNDVEIARATDPTRALGAATAFVDRVVAPSRRNRAHEPRRPAAGAARDVPDATAPRAPPVRAHRGRDLVQARRPDRPRARRQQGAGAGVRARRRGARPGATRS